MDGLATSPIFGPHIRKLHGRLSGNIVSRWET
jgi:hypothetical protein